MKIDIQYGLPFVHLKVEFRGKKRELDKVLLDTGSAGTIFNADVVGEIGVEPEKDDIVDTIRGINSKAVMAAAKDNLSDAWGSIGIAIHSDSSTWYR
ncbi:hypothetical protein MUB24_18705 [Lederbergia sp. NSJ-179]|uniref:hypothetical protein n=1 Tax=Lederbergia sp. NSJ-179 TaxID=2931402 RepID=UPI001FD07B95|nr:hypothetical protein [Lederbergia sp. NSJ-179]MCJ7842871.1 hypothetical protein [Lederbergia sp. NSJ-179]